MINGLSLTQNIASTHIEKTSEKKVVDVECHFPHPCTLLTRPKWQLHRQKSTLE
jgi:hypothetical protein